MIVELRLIKITTMIQLATIDWNRFQNELKGFVFKKVKDKALTEDIIQDVFLKVQNKIEQLKDSEKISEWIYQITRNTIVDHFRKISRNIEPKDLDWENDTPNFNDCASAYLTKLLPTLPEKFRIALELTEFKNMTQLELAAHLGISYSGAKSRVQRARKMLKKKINEVLTIKTDSYGNVIVCDRISCC